MEHLSPLDAAFLDLEDRHCALHIGGIAVFDGPAPTPEEMSLVYARSIALEPRYQRRMKRSRFGLTRPGWVDDPHYDPEYHLRRTAVAAPGGPEQLDRLIGRIMSVRLDITRPPWEVWVVEGLAGGRWALLTKLHHSMVDGLGGMSLFTAMLDSPEPTPEPRLLPPRSRTEDLVESASRQVRSARRAGHAAVAATLQPKHTARAAARTVGGAVEYVRALRPTDPTSLVGSLGTPRRYRTFSVELAEVKAVRAGLGGTVNDVALAMVSRGFRALLLAREERPSAHAVRCLVPVSTRTAGRRTDGNEVSGLLLDLPVDFADPEVAHSAVVARTRALKASHEAEAGQVGVTLATVVPPPLFSLGLRLTRRLPQRVLTTVTTNVPGPRRPVYLLGRRMLALYPYVPIAERVRIGIALTSYADHLQFGVTCDRDSVDDADVLVGGITDGLVELVKIVEGERV